MTYWDMIKDSLAIYAVIILVSTVLVFFVSGRVTQRIITREESRHA